MNSLALTGSVNSAHTNPSDRKHRSLFIASHVCKHPNKSAFTCIINHKRHKNI